MAFPSKKPAAGGKTSASAPAKKTAPVKPARPAAKRPALTAEQKKKLMLHKAPSDMKTFSLELDFKTMKDGMIHPNIRANRVRGRYDNPDAKRFDMMTYDPQTVVALVARLQAAVHATNPLRRLSPNKTFGVVIRVAANAQGNIRCSIQAIKREVVKGDKRKMVWFDRTNEADKTDMDYRKIKRAGRHLVSAFVNCQLPPAGRQPKSKEE